jgi:hypothetical protein
LTEQEQFVGMPQSCYTAKAGIGMEPRMREITSRRNALVEASRDPEERRRPALALEWFYRYVNEQIDLEFESWSSFVRRATRSRRGFAAREGYS